MPPSEDIPFTLLGPKAEVPPGFWSSYWGVAVLVVLFLAVVALVAVRLFRRAPAARPPHAQLEAELTAAESLPARACGLFPSAGPATRVPPLHRGWLHT